MELEEISATTRLKPLYRAISSRISSANSAGLFRLCKKRRGRSPRDLATGKDEVSLKLVRKARRPCLVHPSHVPPPTRSLPPTVSPSSHQRSASVALHKHLRVNHGSSQSGFDSIQSQSPVVIFISVEEEKKRVKRMRLPQKHCYAHSLLLSLINTQPSPSLSALKKVVFFIFFRRLLLVKNCVSFISPRNGSTCTFQKRFAFKKAALRFSQSPAMW